MPTNSTTDRSVRTAVSDERPTEGEGPECDAGAGPSVRRATRMMRLLKLAATTLAALAGAAKALGLV